MVERGLVGIPHGDRSLTRSAAGRGEKRTARRMERGNERKRGRDRERENQTERHEMNESCREEGGVRGES